MTKSRLASGGLLDLLNPNPRLFTSRLVADALAKINRFCGHTDLPYSVAQHSVHVAAMVPERLRRHALLHDAHEAVLGDIPAPVKAALSQLGGGAALMTLECRLDTAIHRAFGLSYPLPAADMALLTAADLRACATEMRDMMGVPRECLPAEPHPHPVRALAWPDAAALWLREWQRACEVAAIQAAPDMLAEAG
jgi:hypothetical protein